MSASGHLTSSCSVTQVNGDSYFLDGQEKVEDRLECGRVICECRFNGALDDELVFIVLVVQWSRKEFLPISTLLGAANSCRKKDSVP